MKFKNKQVLVVGCVAIVCAVVITGTKLHIDKVNVDSSTKVKFSTIQTSSEITTTKSSTAVHTTTSKPTATKTTTKPKPAFYLSEYERWVVECIVMGESGGEPYKGQILVAQCILNGCKKEGIQPSSLRLEYQYSGWDENPTESVKRAVSAVFDDGYKATNEFVLYFYAPKYAKGEWHETQKFVREVGGHRFFAEW